MENVRIIQRTAGTGIGVLIVLLFLIGGAASYTETTTSDFTGGILDNVNISSDELKINWGTLLKIQSSQTDFDSGTYTNCTSNSTGIIKISLADNVTIVTNSTLKRAPASSYGNVHTFNLANDASDYYLIYADVYGDGGTDTFGNVYLVNLSDNAIKIGNWTNETVTSSDSGNPTTIAFNITDYITGGGTYKIMWDYTGGNKGLFIQEVRLVGEGYYNSAVFISSIIDGGEDAKWNNISWQAANSTGNNITFKIRTGSKAVLPNYSITKIGNWTNETVTSSDSGNPTTIAFNITDYITGEGTYKITWNYTGGNKGLFIKEVRLVGDGSDIFTNYTLKRAPASSYGNVHTFNLANDESNSYMIYADVYGDGGTDTFGDVYFYLESSNVWTNYWSRIYTDSSGEPINETFSVNRYLQYKAFLITDNIVVTPILYNVTFDYTRDNGYFESKPYDAGYTANWWNLSWSELAPTGTDILIWAATSDDNLTWSGWHGSYSNPSLNDLSNINDSRYIKYQVKLNSTNATTPILYSISIEDVNSNLEISDLYVVKASSAQMIWANYTNTSANMPVLNAACDVFGDISGTLSWNSSTNRYQDAFVMPDTNGSYSYTVQCNKSGFFTLNRTDSFDVNTSFSVGVCTWKDCVNGAVSYTFDDDRQEFLNDFMPEFDSRGLHMTLYVITGSVLLNGSSTAFTWARLNESAAKGHEIGSHTVNHITPDETEANQSRRHINGNVTNQRYLTLAYPGSICTESARNNVSNAGYISARCWTDYLSPNPSTPIDWFGLASNDSRAERTITDYNNWVDKAESQGGWYILLNHYNTINRTEIAENLDYALNKSVWIETLREVTKYIKERDNFTVSNLSETSTNISFIISDDLEDTIYDEPVTVKVDITDTQTVYSVTIDNVAVNWSYRTISGNKYVLFNSMLSTHQVTITTTGTNANLTVWDGAEGSSQDCNTVVDVYANYTNKTSGQFITGADCNVSFSDDGYSAVYGMEEQGQVYHNDSKSFSSAGTYFYNVTCDHPSFNRLSALDNITIQGVLCDGGGPPPIPEFSTIGIIFVILLSIFGTSLIIRKKK